MDDDRDRRARERAERARAQEQRALDAIDAISRGANPADESMKLANEFTDRHTAGFGDWLRRTFRKR